MKLAERVVTVVLDDSGRQAMQLAGIDAAEGHSILFQVEEADDMGIWARVPRADGDHFVLVRWEFVLTLDIPAGATRKAGIK